MDLFNINSEKRAQSFFSRCQDIWAKREHTDKYQYVDIFVCVKSGMLSQPYETNPFAECEGLAKIQLEIPMLLWCERRARQTKADIQVSRSKNKVKMVTKSRDFSDEAKAALKKFRHLLTDAVHQYVSEQMEHLYGVQLIITD